MLQDGQQKAREKLVHLRNTMQQMEEALRRIEENQGAQRQGGICRRHLSRRLILRQPFTPSGGELAFKQSSTEIFLRGQALGLLPAFTFPIGLIARKRGKEIVTDIFLEVLQQKEDVTDLEVLPEGDYLCQLRPAQALEHVDTLISDYFARHTQADQVIITNLTAAHFDLKGQSLELQGQI